MPESDSQPPTPPDEYRDSGRSLDRVWTFDELRDMYEDDDPKIWMLLGRPK